MDILYKSKFLTAVVISAILVFGYYKWSQNKEDEVENSSLVGYAIGIFCIAYALLFMMEDSSNDAYMHVNTGEPPF